MIYKVGDRCFGNCRGSGHQFRFLTLDKLFKMLYNKTLPKEKDA